MALAIEPEVSSAPAATLESAARANDYATFDTLYRANPNPAYRTLHEVWSYAMTDRNGAFYGTEQYERLAREYPGFASYIANYKIVDSHGAVFYPASETRAFLLEQRGAEIVTALPPVRPVRAKRKAAATHVARVKSTPAPTPAPAPKPAAPPAEDLALLNAALAAPTPTPVQAPAPAPAPAPSVAAPVRVTAAPAPAPAPAKETNRGLLLVIIGLVGVGLLALIVRAPREVIP